MKTIGIIARPDKTINNNDAFIVNKKLISTLDSFNVISLIITPPGKYNYNNNVNLTNKELNKMIYQIDKCDGIILQGGNEFYDFDLELIDYIYKKDIPCLGICLGMQAISSYKNGTIYNINNHYKTNHYINIDKDSKLYKIIKKDKILVNSRHKCAVKNTSFKVNAISNDNIIEGIEDNNKKFFLALQWHPEAITNDINQKKIIQEFINSC